MDTPFFGMGIVSLRSKILDRRQLPIHASRIFLHIRKCGVLSQVSQKTAQVKCNFYTFHRLVSSSIVWLSR